MTINNHPYFGAINGIQTKLSQPQLIETITTIDEMKDKNPTIYNACKTEEMNILKSLCDIQEYKIVFMKVGVEDNTIEGS